MEAAAETNRRSIQPDTAMAPIPEAEEGAVELADRTEVDVVVAEKIAVPADIEMAVLPEEVRAVEISAQEDPATSAVPEKEGMVGAEMLTIPEYGLMTFITEEEEEEASAGPPLTPSGADEMNRDEFGLRPSLTPGAKGEAMDGISIDAGDLFTFSLEPSGGRKKFYFCCRFV